MALEEQCSDLYILKGMIDKVNFESVHITVDGEPLAELAKEFAGKHLSIRYWITDLPVGMEKAITEGIKRAMGLTEAEFFIHYSDDTGYLWTDEDFRVGGHDMIAEMESYIGKHVLMEIRVGEAGDISRKMQDMFRGAYKGNCERDFDPFEDPDGTLSQFTAYRGIFGGMVACQVIREPDSHGGRMNVWFFRRAKSTPIPLEVWGGDVKTKFPKGCLHPDMIEMRPNLMQRRYMVSPEWQPYRVRRPFHG